MNRLTQIAVVVIAASGCTHTIELESTEGVSFYESFEDPVPGVWAVVIDETISDFSSEIELTAQTCKGSSYLFEPGTVTSSSIYETLENVFEETHRGEDAPPAQTVQGHKKAGMVYVRLDEFQGKLECEEGIPGIIGDCIGQARVHFGVQVTGRDKGQLLSFAATSTKNARGRQPAFSCADIGEFIVDSYREALNESLQKIAGRLSNSEQLRVAANLK